MRSIPPSSDVREEAQRRARSLADGLYPHQVEGLAFLLARRGAILADDMGLGKTRQAILAMAEATPSGPYLVVCPASVKANWEREIEAVRPAARVWIVGETPPADWDGWVVVNYDVLKRHIDRLREMSFRGVVFDEAHYLKNHTSQRSRLGRSLIEGERGERPLTYLLTGTPLTNRPRDLFPLLQLVGHPLGRSFLSFAKRYCAATHNGYGWVTDGASNLDELAVQVRGVLLRRTKEEVLDLPAKVRTFLDVEVPEGTAARESRRAFEILLQGDGARRRGDLLGQLNSARHAIAKSKSKATLDFVSGAVAQGEKVIVFSGYDAPLKKIAEHFGDACVTLTGSTPTRSRQKLVDRFQNDPEVRVFAANTLAGGVGLNLTAARQVVFNDLDWVPANHWQAEDRAYRIGQTGSVHVAYMVAPGTLDEFVKHVLEVKAALFGSVIDGRALAASTGGSALDDLQRLLNSISPGLADKGVDRSDPGWAKRLLRETLTHAQAAFEQGGAAGGAHPPPPAVTDELIEWLASALEGPRSDTYRIESGSKPGAYYELKVDGAEVDCTCRGFEYRGTCRHALQLKTCLVEGREVPPAYTRMASV